jgi:hypothetical protein
MIGGHRSMRWLVLVLTGVSAVVGGFEQPSFPAAGRHGTTFNVAEAARYRLEVASPSGTQLRLVSRLTGPGAWSGTVGVSDGSQDLFLDAGVHRADLRGHPNAQGESRLKLTRFIEMHTTPESLPRGLTRTTLKDLEQRTYTLTVAEAGPVFIEVAGRALGGVAIRNDRDWLLHAVEPTATLTPVPGQPVRSVSLAVPLDAGTYKLSAFGARQLAWAKDEDAAPLYLRRGIEVLAPDHKARHVTSVFGVDRFLVPAFASFARLELPVSAPALLRAQLFDGKSIFQANGQQVEIDERQRVPVARVELSRHGIARLDALGATHFAALPMNNALRRFWQPLRAAAVSKVRYHLIMVSMLAGRGYALQLARDERRIVVQRAGRYFIEVASAADVRDSAAVTALAFAGRKRETRHSVVLSDAIEVSAKTSLRSQFNLDGRTELFLQVRKSGRYRLFGGGISAMYEVQPYGARNDTAKRSFRSTSSAGVTLERGFYRLTLSAPRSGTHQLNIQGADAVQSTFRRLRSAARFSELEVLRGEEAVIGIAAAMSDLSVAVRALPVDLRIPMTMVLEPGQALRIPVRMAATSAVYLQHDGAREDFQLRFAGQVSSNSLRLPAGVQAVSVVSADVVPRRVTLVRRQRAAQVNLPGRSDAVLSTGTSLTVSLSSVTPRQAWVDIPAPGVYRMETTGLLATAAELSSFNVLNLASGNNNGTGRNFRLLRWLSKGRWRLGLRALGRSAGDTQLSLTRAPMLAQDELKPGAAVARGMRPGESWPIALRISEPGDYALQAMTLSGALSMDVRDALGWPLVTPGETLDTPIALARGRYDLLIHAPRTPGQVVVELDVARTAPDYRGHGPHSIKLGQLVKHRWNSGQADHWHFRLSADAQFTIRVTPGMAGRLVSPDGRQLELTGAPLTVAGKTGRYQLSLAHSRDDSRHDYRLQIVSSTLLPGQRRALKLPAELQVAVPPSGYVHLRSTGNSDVRARLTDAKGRLLASGDDAGANWNFDLRVATLEPTVHLTLWSVGKAPATTTIHHVESTTKQARTSARFADAGPSSITIKLPPHALTLLTTPAQSGVIAGPMRPAHSQGRLVFASAEAARSLTVPVGVEVARRTFAASVTPLDSEHVQLLAGQAKRIELPHAHSRVMLDLPAGVYALLGLDTVGSDRPSRWTVDTDANTLYLLNPLALDRQAGVQADELIDDMADNILLNAAVPGHWRPSHRWQAAHRRHVPLAITGPATGPPYSPFADAFEIAHMAGRISAWNLNVLKSKVGDSVHISARDFADSVTLQGATAVTLDRTSTFYKLRTDAPVAWFTEHAGVTHAGVLSGATMHLLPRTFAAPEPVPPMPDLQETHQSRAQVLGLLPLYDTATVQLDTVTPMTLVEGLADPRWLASKAQMLFRFELAQATRVGIGAKGSLGPARLHLLRDDDDARVAGPPPVARWPQMLERDLARGKYFLLIANPMDVPQSVQAALAGTDVPASVPAAVVRRYLSGVQP